MKNKTDRIKKTTFNRETTLLQIVWGTRNWSARCSLLNKPGIQGFIELFIMYNFQRFSLQSFAGL